MPAGTSYRWEKWARTTRTLGRALRMSGKGISMVAVRERTYAEIQAAYDARKTSTPFGWEYVNLFEVDIMRTPEGDPRRGVCQFGDCTQIAPVELLGRRKGYISGCALTRSRRTCAFHFWQNVDAVLWLHHVPS